MGSTRQRPERLAEKLQQIRLALGLSQSEIVRRLGIEDQVDAARISGFEIGLREPTLMVLLQYSRAAGVHTEVLIDDDLNLPDTLPDTVSHEEIKRRYTPRRKKR